MNEGLEKPPTLTPPAPLPAPAHVSAPAPAQRASAPRAAQPPPAPRHPQQPPEDEEDEDGFFERHGLKLVAGLVIAGIGIGAVFYKPGPSEPLRKAPDRMVSIQLPPPPPPPPPPAPPKVEPPPPPEQKMIEQAPVEPEEKPPEAPKPKDEPPPAALGTNIKGPGGADGFGLGTSGNGGGLGLGSGGNGGRAGSKWGWYAGQVQSRIAEALRQNRATRSASLRVEVRVWADLTGRITRAQLVGSSGDAALDRTLQNEVLTGLRLAEPPPEGMPMPIVLRLSARRPN